MPTMNNLISLTTLSVCLITGQLFCPQFAQATTKIDPQNPIPLNEVVVSTSEQMSHNGKRVLSQNKDEDLPDCTEDCSNAGVEGGGGG